MCAAPLDERMAFGRMRPVCPRCGYVAFRNPKVAAGVLVERDGAVLFTRRAHDPGRGLWALPAGYMEWDETTEGAAVREAREETGVDVRIDRLVGIYSTASSGVVLVIYAAFITGGELCVGDECEDVAFFLPDDLPKLAFPSTDAILADWRAPNNI
jgi:ADP-ribose pyrophosphatase YjhB (NUDIX family)